MWYNIYVQHVREFLALFYLRVISSGLKFMHLVVFQSISYVCSCLMANVQYIWNECSFAFYSCWDHCVITRNLVGITLNSIPEQLIIIYYYAHNGCAWRRYQPRTYYWLHNQYLLLWFCPLLCCFTFRLVVLFTGNFWEWWIAKISALIVIINVIMNCFIILRLIKGCAVPMLIPCQHFGKSTLRWAILKNCSTLPFWSKFIFFTTLESHLLRSSFFFMHSPAIKLSN